jgi:hypothetical protein
MRDLKNTKHNGVAHFVIFHDEKQNKEGAPSFTAVCLDFDIVESGNDLDTLTESILEAAKSHLVAVREENLSDSLLNRKAPKKYWDLYYSALAKELEESYKSKSEIKRTENNTVSSFFRIPNRELMVAC